MIDVTGRGFLVQGNGIYQFQYHWKRGVIVSNITTELY